MTPTNDVITTNDPSLQPKSIFKKPIYYILVVILAIIIVGVIYFLSQQKSNQSELYQFIGQVKQTQGNNLQVWVKASQNEIPEDFIITVLVNEKTNIVSKTVPKTLDEAKQQKELQDNTGSKSMEDILKEAGAEQDENGNLIIEVNPRDNSNNKTPIKLGANNILENMEIIVTSNENIFDQNQITASKIEILK